MSVIKNPLVKRQVEQINKVGYSAFLGMIKDIPASQLPEGYASRLINLIARGSWVEGRPGTFVVSNTAWPTTTLNATLWHSHSSLAIQQFSANLYWSVFAGLGYCNLIINMSAVALGNTESELVEFNKQAYVFNTTGIFRIKLNDVLSSNIPYAYRINLPLPTVIPTDIPEVVYDDKMCTITSNGWVDLIYFNLNSDNKIITNSNTWSAGDKVRFLQHTELSIETYPAGLQVNTDYYIIPIVGSSTTFYLALTYADALAGTAFTFQNSGNAYMRAYKNNYVTMKDSSLVISTGSEVVFSNKTELPYPLVAGQRYYAYSGGSEDNVFSVAYSLDYALAGTLIDVYKPIVNEPDYSLLSMECVTDTIYKNTFGYKYTYSLSRIWGVAGVNVNRLTSGASLELETGTCDALTASRDFGTLFFSEKINPSQVNSHVVGTLTVPYGVNEVTHFSLYRTLNIGKNSNPPGTGTTADSTGTDPEQFVWVDDIPIAKAFSDVNVTPYNPSTKIFDSGVNNLFVNGDIGNSLYNLDGLYFGKIASIPAGLANRYIVIDTSVGNALSVGWTCTFTADLGNNRLHLSGCYNLRKGTRITFTSTGTLPAPLVAGTVYYSVGLVYSAYAQVATTYANAIAEIPITLTDAGSGTHTLTTSLPQYLAFGGGRVIVASQTYFTVTRTDGATFSASDVGLPIFWSDGGYSIILAYLTASTVSTVWGATHASQAATLKPTSGNFSRVYNDTTPDNGIDYNVTGLSDRIAANTSLYTPRRFFQPLPASNVGIIDNGYLICGTRDSTKYYYSQYGDKPYTMGFYRPGTQEGETKTGIREIVAISNAAIFFLNKKTYRLAMNIADDVGNALYGEAIFMLRPLQLVDDNRGVYHYKTIRMIRGPNVLMAVTDEPAVRMFNGDAWDEVNHAIVQGYSAVMQDLLSMSIKANMVASYVNRPNGGYKLWAYAAGSTAFTCLRYAVEQTQGYGWSEITGSHWPVPMKSGVLNARDSIGDDRCYLFEYRSWANQDFQYFVHEEGTYDINTYTYPHYRDQENSSNDDVSGISTPTEITTEFWGREHTAAPNETNHIYTEKSFDYIRPQDVSLRGLTGYSPGNAKPYLYDANGIKLSQIFSVEEYVDGEKTTPQAIARDYPDYGNIVFDGARQATRRLQFVFKSTASQFRRTGTQHDLIVVPDTGSRTERTMSEHTYESYMSSSTYLKWHLNRSSTDLYERVSRAAKAFTTITRVTGPDGRSLSAYRGASNPSASDVYWTLDNPAISGAYSFIAWVGDVTKMNVFTNNISGTLYNTKTNFTLVWGTSTNLSANSRILVKAGYTTPYFFDIRFLSVAIDVNLVADYWIDITKNEGRKYLSLL
jgi:hypothetical protein